MALHLGAGERWFLPTCHPTRPSMHFWKFPYYCINQQIPQKCLKFKRAGWDGILDIWMSQPQQLSATAEIPVTEKTQANRFSSPMHSEDTAALPHWKDETLVLSFSMVLC